MTSPMRCRAVGLRPGGEMTGECDMPHGHTGACGWVLRTVIDEQLRAECERRGIIGENYALRRNAEERWEAASARCIELELERDKWKRRAEDEREKWQSALLEQQSRAEAAEAKLAEPVPVVTLYRTVDRLPIARELGPGIAKQRFHSDTTHWVDPYDFLEDA